MPRSRKPINSSQMLLFTMNGGKTPEGTKYKKKSFPKIDVEARLARMRRLKNERILNAQKEQSERLLHELQAEYKQALKLPKAKRPKNFKSFLEYTANQLEHQASAVDDVVGDREMGNAKRERALELRNLAKHITA